MAHNLATINGRVSMAYQGETPWHHLGNRVASLTNTADALLAAELNWLVSLAPLYLADGRKVDSRFATIRDTDNAVLGTVGPNYTPIQNHNAAAVLDDVCKDYGVTIETVGALGIGEKVWMLGKMHQTIEPIAGDRINGYFLSHWSHDGTTAYQAQLTPVRVVCQNTLNAATSGRQAFISIRHTASSTDRINEARRLVTAMTASLKSTGETYAALAHKAMTQTELADYINALIPQPDPKKPSETVTERRETIAALCRYGAGADMANQAMPLGQISAWSAVNAVAEYWDHCRPAETKSDSARLAANESAIFGAGAASKRQALNMLIDMTGIHTEPASLIA